MLWTILIAVGFLALLVFGFLGVLALVVVVAVALKRRGIDVTDGIDAGELQRIKLLWQTRKQREQLEATKAEMIKTATDPAA